MNWQFVLMWARAIGTYALFVGAIIATGLALQSLLQRWGFFRERSISILHVPEGYKADGGKSLERMNRRWRFYDAAFPIMLWMLYILWKYINARLGI